MDDFMKHALEIAKAQAGVRQMTPEEIIAYAKDIAEGLIGVAVAEELTAYVDSHPLPVADRKNSIKEKSITCLVSGKSFKMLGKKHLAGHGLTPDEYREQFGLKTDVPLVCKALARSRHKTMKDMRLWERPRRAGR